MDEEDERFAANLGEAALERLNARDRGYEMEMRLSEERFREAGASEEGIVDRSSFLSSGASRAGGAARQPVATYEKQEIVDMRGGGKKRRREEAEEEAKVARQLWSVAEEVTKATADLLDAHELASKREGPLKTFREEIRRRMQRKILARAGAGRRGR